MLTGISDYSGEIASAIKQTTVSTTDGGCLDLDFAIGQLRSSIRLCRTFFIGNGGSAAIASHLAVDFALKGCDAAALNDFVALTSYANDFEYEHVFRKQLELRKWNRSEILVAMSCSGESKNIIEAAIYARRDGISLVTLSGGEESNSLRQLGHFNLYTPSKKVGIVQIAHLTLMHCVCDGIDGPIPRPNNVDSHG